MLDSKFNPHVGWPLLSFSTFSLFPGCFAYGPPRGGVLSAEFVIESLSVEIAEIQFSMIPVLPDLLSVCEHFAVRLCIFAVFYI